MEQYGNDHPYTAMPPIGDHEYMAGLFIDTGLGNRAGMGGMTSLTWVDLQSFDQCGRLELTGWELSRLMDMSREYCHWQAKGSQQGDIAPDIPYIDRTKDASGYLMRNREASAKNAADAKSGRID